MLVLSAQVHFIAQIAQNKFVDSREALKVITPQNVDKVTFIITSSFCHSCSPFPSGHSRSDDIVAVCQGGPLDRHIVCHMTREPQGSLAKTDTVLVDIGTGTVKWGRTGSDLRFRLLRGEDA